jgi:hypothetical protein
MTSHASRFKLRWLLLTAVLACDGGTGPSSGSLTVTVIGLPGGSSAAITVSGPGGFSQPVTGTQTLSQLTPGTYTVAAGSVMVGTEEYDPSPPSQTVAVNGTASASVSYGPATGNLSVTVNGLGTGNSAAVTVTGAGGYSRAVTATTTIAGLNPGDYTVSARDTVATGGTPHTASPASQTVTVPARMTGTATVTYSPPPNDGTVNLRVAGVYLTQSAQNYAGSVPLVRNRDGYLRVFVVANRTNTAAPSVRVRLYNGALPPDTMTILPPTLSVPTVVDESSLSYSWNVLVSGALIQPGLMVEAEVDPAGSVLETDETDNKYPAAGPSLMDVRTVPTLDVTFVPVLQRGIPIARRIRGNVTDANKAQFLQPTQKMHPIAAYNAVVHADYTTTTLDTLQDLNGNGAWATILGEIDALRVAESSTRYYYGVARVSYTSGVAGVAYVSTPSIGGRAALGWDYLPSGGIVAAHELGHNWGRNHAPCGGPGGVDTQYPQSDGSTGIYGVDVAAQTLEPPTDSDIMGYCDDKWISDYTYGGVLNYLLAPSQPFMGTAGSQAVQPCLLVWGHIRDGEIVLEPAFQVNTRPSLPVRPGAYSLEGRADDGTSVFALSFTPSEVADARQSQQNFVFAVPLTPGRTARLSSLRLAGRGREAVSRAAVVGPDSVEVRRVAGGRVGLRWNAGAHPMVMVRDPDTGEVLSFARGGDVELSTSKGQVDLVLSDRVKSRVKRVQVVQ